MCTKSFVVDQRVQQLAEERQQNFTQVNAQRIFGPPRNWRGEQPARGSEVFVGNLPRNLYEDVLVPLFEHVGPIYMLRTMVHLNRETKGYAFVTYATPEMANQAVSVFNNYEIRPGHVIGVQKSVDNCRLYLGGLPTILTEEQVMRELIKVVDNVKHVIMYPSYEEQHHNRGYVFVEFADHKSAAIARRTLNCASNLWNTRVFIEWAHPLPVIDDNIIDTISKLFIRNLNVTMTYVELQTELFKYIPKVWITKLYRCLDYAFVQFRTHEEAECALKLLGGIDFNGRSIEVSWARPQIYSKCFQMKSPIHNYCTSVPPRMRNQVIELRRERTAFLSERRNILQQIFNIEEEIDSASTSGLQRIFLKGR